MPLEKRKSLKPQMARVLAAGFLTLGLALGFFDAPQYFEKVTGYQLPVIFNFPFRLGLDIQGGTHLVYQADLANIASEERADSMEAVRDVIERRVNLFGVAEPLVQVEGVGEDRRLIVELAGVKDINQAIRLIGETPYLEFKEERPEEEREEILEYQERGERLLEDPNFASTPLTGRYVRRAEVEFDPVSSQPLVTLELTGEGAEIFAELTKRNLGKPLAIFLDGAPLSAPIVQEEISGGKAQISGNFTPQEAKELAGRMNAGALPVPIRLIAQQTVGASLGEESFAQGVRAALLGFAAVALFMIFWYRLPGFLAVLALLFYAAAVLAVFKLIPVTLTIAGIAGFVLSLGMAVDANILVFERLKEEIRGGKPYLEALREGFGRAWTSIRDSNISSLITASILYWLGSGVVQGFATTLGIGILVSMFSALVVLRVFMYAAASLRGGS